MENLLSDVQIKIPANGRKRILGNFEINSGITVIDSDNYFPGSVIPKNDWRVLTEEESFLLFTDDLKVQNQVISILDLDSKLKKAFTNFDQASSQEELFQIYHQLLTEDEEFKYNISSFLKEQLNPGVSLGTLSLLCLAQLEPNMDTVAFDVKTGKRFGLHFDHSEHSTLYSVKNHKSRICINMGEEHRYIMFINLGIEKVFELIKLNDPGITENISETHLAKKFFELYPNYPVIRFKQERFQCYIAPTDYVIHDGSTLNKTKHDKTMVYLGYFNTGGVS